MATDYTKKLWRYLPVIVLLTLVLTGCTGRIQHSDVLTRPPVSERLSNADELLFAREYKRAAGVYNTVVLDLAQRSDDLDNNTRQASPSTAITEELTDDEIKQALSQAYTGLGMTELHFGNWRKAIKLFDAAEKQVPDFTPAREGRGLVMLAQAKFDQAYDQLAPLEKSPAASWRLHNALGVIADFKQDYPAAAQHYRNALEQGGHPVQCTNNLGYSYIMMGSYDQAAEVFRELVSNFPEEERPRSNLALTLARDGQYREAAKQWTGVIGEANAWLNTGYIAMLNKDYSRAETFLEKAIALSPRYFPEAEQHLARLKALKP